MKELKLTVNNREAHIEINEDGSCVYINGKFRKWVLRRNRYERMGYYKLRIYKKDFSRSQLVAYAFLGPKPKNKIVMHKDSNTLNDHYSNLRYAYKNEIWKNSQKNGLHVGLGASNVSLDIRKGNRIYPEKISAEEAKKIAIRLDKGEYAKDICKEYNVSEMTIRRIRKRYCIKKQVSPRYDKEVKEIVIKLLLDHTVSEVSEITGLSYNLVYFWSKNKIQLKWYKPLY